MDSHWKNIELLDTKVIYKFNLESCKFILLSSVLGLYEIHKRIINLPPPAIFNTGKIFSPSWNICVITTKEGCSEVGKRNEIPPFLPEEFYPQKRC